MNKALRLIKLPTKLWPGIKKCADVENDKKPTMVAIKAALIDMKNTKRKR